MRAIYELNRARVNGGSRQDSLKVDNEGDLRVIFTAGKRRE